MGGGWLGGKIEAHGGKIDVPGKNGEIEQWTPTVDAFIWTNSYMNTNTQMCTNKQYINEKKQEPLRVF